MSKPAALIRPQAVRFIDALPEWPLRRFPRCGSRGRCRRRPTSTAPASPRRCSGCGTPPAGCTRWCWPGRCGWWPTARWTRAPCVDRLVAADAAANAYLVDLTAAGGGYAGAALVGASPELLVARRGERGDVPAVRRLGAAVAPTPTRTGPTAPRWPSRPRTATSTSWSSTRCARRSTRCASTCRSPPNPQLSSTAAVWHLSTPITGRLRETSTTALDLAVALHPTPAVGGVPAARGRGADRRTGGRPRLLRRRGGLVRRSAATAAGWCRSGAPSCPPTAAPPSPTPAAASSPNPIPTTKSPKPQRNSERSCLRWEAQP